MAQAPNPSVWDNTRFNPRNYAINQTQGLLKLQKTIRDFVRLVRTEDSGLTQTDCNNFAVFVDSNVSWPIAQRLVAEFRQYYTDAEIDIMRSPMRLILRSLMEKNRVHRPPKYAALNREQKNVRNRLEQQVALVETVGQGIRRAPKQDRDVSQLHARRIESIIERGESLNFEEHDEIAIPIFFEDQLVMFEYHKTWYEIKPTSRHDVLSLEDRSRTEGLPVVVKVTGGAGLQPMLNTADGTMRPHRPRPMARSSTLSDFRVSQAPRHSHSFSLVPYGQQSSALAPFNQAQQQQYWDPSLPPSSMP